MSGRCSRRIAGWAAAVLALAASATGQGFVERAAELGLVHWHASGFDRVGDIPQQDWMQSGIALGDLDGDGDLDVVACGGLLRSSVFRNDGGSFTDVTAFAGIEAHELDRVPALGDYDGDGDLDLFLGALDPGDGPVRGSGRLYRNDGRGHFDDVTTLSRTLGAGHTAHARWVDVDLDGLLDLYTGEFHATPNQLYLNSGDGTFTEVGAQFGVDDRGSAHVVAALDTSGDGLVDLYLGNDYSISFSGHLAHLARDAELHGTATGAFLDVSLGAHFTGNSTMGLAFGDVDYDGRLDVYKTEYGTNYLLLNRGWPESGSAWEEAQYDYGVANVVIPGAGSTAWAVGWGTSFGHFDLDPWLDLVLVNGHVDEDDARGQQNFIYRGGGPAAGHAFTDVSQQWGFVDHYEDRALAVGDVDGDGDLDLFVGPVTGRLRYFENRIDRAGQGWLAVRPLTRTSAPGGLGVRVEWTDALGFPHVRIVGSEAPTASQNALEAFFGLGTEERVDVHVGFPSGVTQVYVSVPRNTLLIAEEPELIRLPARTVSIADAGRPFVVTAFAHDARGRPLSPRAVVAIGMEGLDPITGVEHVQANEFRRAFRLPAEAGRFRVSVAFDGFQVRIRPRLVVIGAVDGAATTVDFAPRSVRAGSDDRARIVAVPRDAQGLAIGPGYSVSARVRSVPSMRAWTPLSDLGDGRYAGEVLAPPDPGVHAVDLAVEAAMLAGAGALIAAGPAEASMTRVYIEDPDPGIAASPHELRVRITPRDAFGIALGPRTLVELGLRPDRGSEPIWIRGGGAFAAQRDGDFLFVVLRDIDAAPDSATGTLGVVVEGRTLATVPYAF